MDRRSETTESRALSQASLSVQLRERERQRRAAEQREIRLSTRRERDGACHEQQSVQQQQRRDYSHCSYPVVTFQETQCLL